MIEEAIYTRLSGFSGLVALISTRVYDVESVPQNPTRPFVTYQRVSGRRVQAMGVFTGLVSPGRYQVVAHAATYRSAKAVRTQLLAALDRWRGTDGTVTVQDTFVENDVDLPYDLDTQDRAISLDAVLHFREG